MGFGRWCAFSSSPLATTLVATFRAIPHAFFSLLFPADCRLCNVPLTRWTRVPVCASCLAVPQPLDAEYFCGLCRTPFANSHPLDREGVCAACRLNLRGFDRAASFGFYDGSLRSLIHLFKYAGMAPLAAPLGRFLERALPLDVTYDAVVPVPMHWRRKWQRGFNQAELLARHIARRRALPLLNALQRRRSAGVQASLSVAARHRNASGAFALKTGIQLAGKRILLIDDVMTTGATASACAAALKRGGATSVSLLTLARVDRRWTEPK